MIDHEIVNEFCPELRPIIDREFELGNVIVRTYRGSPHPDGLFIMFGEAMFTYKHEFLSAVEVTHISDYPGWLSEYTCKDHPNMLIACGSEGERLLKEVRAAESEPA